MNRKAIGRRWPCVEMLALRLLHEGVRHVPSGRFGERLAFDGGYDDATVDNERGDGATYDEAEGYVGEMLHGVTFPR